MVITRKLRSHRRFPMLGLVMSLLLTARIHAQVYMSSPHIRSDFDGADITDSLSPGSMVEYVRGTITNDNFSAVNSIHRCTKRDGGGLTVASATNCR